MALIYRSFACGNRVFSWLQVYNSFAGIFLISAYVLASQDVVHCYLAHRYNPFFKIFFHRRLLHESVLQEIS